MAKRKYDLTGQKIKMFTVLELSNEKDKNGKKKWKCQCECGNIRYILAQDLMREKGQKSCGCNRIQSIREARITHGMSDTRLYDIWIAMKSRCENPKNTNYHHYGGREIKVCNEWREFENFMEWALNNGYTDELSIDRIDVNGDYEPSNCQWVTQKVQMNNTRRTKKLTYDGVTMSLTMWAEEVGISQQTLTQRIKSGWSIDKALTTPTRRNKEKQLKNNYLIWKSNEILGIKFVTSRFRTKNSYYSVSGNKRKNVYSPNLLKRLGVA
ncbi:hypothetical protein ACQKFG_18590 [Peribacillus sp. NPDC076916]|uniref:hypothetical protein n=1 Tax=Peribacillus sp. NPDC076916 TaxID=3390608 RepID=UPI003D085A02